jgi:arabinogalactan oligomer / maltooligosaccharide transport system substrate-binding protein
MKKNLLALLSALIVVSLALSACGGGGAPASGATEVTFWHAYGTGSAEETVLAKILEQAATDLPQYKINVLQVPFNDIFNKYDTDVAAGGGPDMFIAPNDNLGGQVRAGTVMDITDLVAGKLGDYSELSQGGMMYDGKMYGIPESLKAVAFWYNKELLPTPPATTDELKALMEAGTPVSISYGCYHHWGFFGSFGAQVFDDGFNFVTDDANQAKMTDSISYLNDLYQISKAEGWPKNDSDGLAPFTEGTTGCHHQRQLGNGRLLQCARRQTRCRSDPRWSGRRFQPAPRR